MARTTTPTTKLAGVAAFAVLFAAAALSAAAQDRPVRGGTLIFGLPNDPQQLNIAITTNTTSQQAATNLFSTLVRVNKDGEVEGDLAESWTMASDGLTYTFKLRPGIKWHDGKLLTAEDVRWALTEINMKYNPVASTAFAPVDRIEAPDERTLVFRMKYPFPPFMPWSLVGQWIYPRHLYEGTDPRQNERNYKNPVGTGPFVFKEYVKGSHVMFERNPNYYKPGMPYLDRVVGKVIPDNAAMVLALEAGEVDYLSIYSLPPTAVPELRKNKDVTVFVDRNRANFGTIMAHVNLRHEILKNKAVRQALFYAIDRKVLAERAMAGLGDPGSSPFSSHMKKWYNPAVKDRYPYDPKKAEAMLDAAGYKKGADGKRFSIRLSYGRTAEAGALHSAAELMREQLKLVGVDLVLDPKDQATWMDAAHVKWDFDLSMGSYQTGPDPAIGAARLYTCKNIQRMIGRNLMGYCNEEVDKLFDAGEKEVDEAKRRALYNKVQEVLVDDAPAIWLWDKYSPVAYRAKARGNLPPGGTHQENFDGVWLVGGK